MKFSLDPLLLEHLNEECDRMLNESSLLGVYDPGTYCEGVFDGFACWNDTPPGQIVNQTCPQYVTGFEPHRFSFKECHENGSWFKLLNNTWTNYSECINMEDLLWQQHVTLVYITGYSVSLVALLLSLAILWYFKSLRCARIILHMNLFASFAVNNALWLIWYEVITSYSNLPILFENWISCQVLHVVLQYFLITNYAWMLCEGMYLHTVLVSAFISESKLLVWLNVFGWSVPLCIITPYVAARICAGDTGSCWMGSDTYENILRIPVCIFILLNLMFLFNIVRVLLVKIKAGPHVRTTNGPSRAALQGLRATFLLVPLLGLSYLLIPIRPDKGHPLEKTYDIISAIAGSFQGLCVTILFCFLNSEVISQVKRKWRNIMFRPRANSCTANTMVSYVAGEEKICLNKASTKKLLQRNLSQQRHNLQGNDRSIDKVNVLRNGAKYKTLEQTPRETFT